MSSNQESEMDRLLGPSHTPVTAMTFPKRFTPSTRGQKGLRCKNIIAIVGSLLFCGLGCLNYISSIFIEVLCMWNLNTSWQSITNSSAGMHTNQTRSVMNDTCNPEKSQEDIPYDLIDLVLYIQPAIVILFWKCKFAKHIDEYEGDNGTTKQEENYRMRRTCYFLFLNMLFLFLFDCVECTNCSFLNPIVFWGMVTKTVNKPACPWMSFSFQFVTLLPAYSMSCWYATKMACVLRRRAKKINKETERLFGTDNQTKDPRTILKELNKVLLYDTWGEKVWKNIAIVMNIMMYIAVILVLLYTHVYMSEVELTLGQWSSHFMRLLTIASLSLTPYMNVAFACVEVTEAFKEMAEKSMEAERNDNVIFEDEDSDTNQTDHSATSQGTVDVVKIAIETNKKVQSTERCTQWGRLLQQISKVQKTVLYNGILSSAYTTLNGVHWTLLAMVGALAFQVLDHLNAFEESKATDASKDRFIVTLFGALALLVSISGVLFVLFWQICGCCGYPMFKKKCCRKLRTMKTKMYLVAFVTVMLGITIYICFYFAVAENKNCTIELNPLVT